MESILEGNKLIQDFYGWKLVCLNPDEDEDDRYYEFHLFNEKGEVIAVDSGGDSWCWNKDSVLPFDKDWNRLMPVVEKINHIDNHEYDVIIFRSDCHINNRMCILFESSILKDNKTLIETVWGCIVEFIKWYNTQHSTP